MSDNSSTEKAISLNEKSNIIHNVVSISPEQIGDPNAILTTIISPSGKEVQVTGDVDDAMRLALKAGSLRIDEESSKRLLRKIDFYLMPLLCFLYSVQFMDKVTNSYASVMGLRTDLNMTGDLYSWVGSGFYFGYLIAEFPVTYMLQKLPMAKTAACFILLWGVVMCLHATPDYGGFIFLRVFLGCLESAITPAMVILTSQWWRKEEQFLRTAIWFCCNGWGLIMGSAIAYGLAIHADSYSIPAWKILFIITGLMTIVVGLLFLLHVPDTPAGAWFLTEEEKLLVVERIRTNNQGFGNRHFKMYQFKEAIYDYRTWICFLYAFSSSVPNGGLTNFSSILLSEDFGFTAVQTLYMNMPTGAVEVVGCSLLAYFHKFFKQRLPISIFAIALSFACSCMLAFADKNKTARLAGYYLMTVAPIGMICCLSLFSSNTAGHTKKVTVNAIYLVGYCTGNIAGPHTFNPNQAPHYAGAKICVVVCTAGSLLLLVALYFSYLFDNKRRDKLAEERRLAGEDEQFMENQEFADLTDFENPNFRYQL